MPFVKNDSDGVKRPDITKKRTMIVSIKSIRQLINYEPEENQKKMTYIEYKPKEEDPTTRVLNL